jgi:D-alanyl-D-alanine carboxypeptidase
MNAYNVPALSIAITKGEKLVYVKAYGEADYTVWPACQNN